MNQIELAARNLTAVYISQQVNLRSRFHIIPGDSLQVTSESPENIENTIKVANLFKKNKKFNHSLRTFVILKTFNTTTHYKPNLLEFVISFFFQFAKWTLNINKIMRKIKKILNGKTHKPLSYRS